MFLPTNIYYMFGAIAMRVEARTRVGRSKRCWLCAILMDNHCGSLRVIFCSHGDLPLHFTMN